jgi:hypothetical protein
MNVIGRQAGTLKTAEGQKFTGWPSTHVLIAGGLAQSAQLVEDQSALLPAARFEVLPESGYLEALGAAVTAGSAGPRPLPERASWLKPVDAGRFPAQPVVRKNKSRPLSGLLHQAVFVMQATEHRRLRNAETRWQLVSMAAGRNLVLGGFR